MKKILLFLLTLLITLSACAPNDQETRLNVFSNEIRSNDWTSNVITLSSLIKEKPEKIRLQNLTIAWSNGLLESINMKVRIDDTNKGYTILFDGQSKNTIIKPIGVLDKLGKEVSLEYIFELLKIHGLEAFGGDNTNETSFLMLTITYGNIEYRNVDLMENRLYKLNKSSLIPFMPNEVLLISNCSVAFTSNCSIYILEELSGNI